MLTKRMSRFFSLTFILVAALMLAQIPQVIAAESFDSLSAEIAAANAGGGNIAISLSGDIVLSGALPAITGNITIDGDGHSISGNNQHRILDVDGGTLTIKNLTLSEGNAERGGAIRLRNSAQVSIEASTLANNTATDGGAIATSSSGDMLNVNDSSFSGNIAEKSAGAILADHAIVSIVNSKFVKNCGERATNGVTTEVRPDNFKLSYDPDGCVHITEFWIERLLEGDGGAIRLLNGAQVTIDRSTFSENKATHGGAISTSGGNDRLTIESSSFTRNRAEASAGVIDVVGGFVSISASSFLNNSAQVRGGVMTVESGGVQVVNSTFDRNRADANGGVLSLDGGEVTMTHVTMSNNAATHTAGNAIARNGGIVNLLNSIVAGSGPDDDCSGGMNQSIGNLSRDASCGLSTSDDLLLGSLQGSPAWYPLQDSSPAIDAADPAYCLETDQIGTARPIGGGCDIGAIETTAAPAAKPIVPPPPCPLALKIVAANTDAPAGGCRAGSGHDVITLTQDITLGAALPPITSNITIEGNGFTISGEKDFRIFSVDAGKLTINNLTLTKGRASALNEHGGAIRVQGTGRIEVNDSTFSNNFASAGGAIGGINLQQTRSTVNNSSFVGNKATYGGAIRWNNGGSITITNSSFLKNGVQGYFGDGGALASLGGTVDVSNSTFIDNSANSGGAVYARWANVTLTHVTMFDNYAGDGVGVMADSGGFGGDIGRVRLRNSIIAGGGSRDDCSGHLTQNVGNLIEDGSCSPALSGEPIFAEPDGTSVTLALQANSPAIDAGDPAYCLATDQVGKSRSRFGLCDIGAIESIPVAQDVSDCTVTTTHGLNFREEPGGDRFGAVPKTVTMAAIARTPGWFKVEHRDRSGWISADYVVTEGDCA